MSKGMKGREREKLNWKLESYVASCNLMNGLLASESQERPIGDARSFPQEKGSKAHGIPLPGCVSPPS